MELRNWHLCFGCASEEFRVVVASLADWMANSSPPWAAYRELMACRLVALDKRPGVRPVGIGETLRLVPRCPHDKFSEGPAEHLPYDHREDPRPFIKCD